MKSDGMRSECTRGESLSRGQPPLPSPRPAEALLRLEASGRILSQAECEALVQQVYVLAQGGGWTAVRISSEWQGQLRWARNRVRLASDRRHVEIQVIRTLRGRSSKASTDQLDPAALEAVVRQAEFQALFGDDEVGVKEYQVPTPAQPVPSVTIWSEATNTISAAARCSVAEAVMAPAEEKGMLSAGYLEVCAGTYLRQSNQPALAGTVEPVTYSNNWGGTVVVDPVPYTGYTTAQCSMTVRDPAGTGSGWAGLTSYDWGALDVPALGARALEKCLASRHPVALEPGRYTVILEPQAVAELVSFILPPTIPLRKMSRRWPEAGPQRGKGSPWYLEPDAALGVGRSKLGLKVVDERVTLSHDPADPLLGILPMPGVLPVTWIKDGVLTALGYDRQYAIDKLHSNDAVQDWGRGYRMSGGATTIEEMIQSTKRGLLVTRFNQIAYESYAEESTLLCTGLTRDGLWLIENGKITKAVKNMRFTESPLFVLNAIEQLGVPVPVFRTRVGDGPTPAIVPPLKVRDFSFTSLVDAV